MSYATCHTENCSNAGEAIDVGDLTYTDEEGDTYTSSVACGVCGQVITDIADTPPDPDPDPPRPDNTLPEHATARGGDDDR